MLNLMERPQDFVLLLCIVVVRVAGQFYSLKDRIRYLHLAQAMWKYRTALWSLYSCMMTAYHRCLQEQRKNASSASLQDELALRLRAVLCPEQAKTSALVADGPLAASRSVTEMLDEAEKLQLPLLQDLSKLGLT